MSSSHDQSPSGVVMQVVGVAMLVVALVWLFAADDPFPMWLIISGGGVMFLGVGAAVQRREN